MRHYSSYKIGALISVLWLLTSIAIVSVHYHRVKTVPAALLARFPLAQVAIGASDYYSPFWHVALSHPPVNPKITNGVSEMLASPGPLFKVVPNYKVIAGFIAIPFLLIWCLALILSFLFRAKARQSVSNV
jgi:hypothetical protein